MKVVAFDTETFATRPGLKAPPLVCLTWMASGDERPSILHGKDPGAKAFFKDWITDPEVLITGHFVAYDMAVCAAAWPDLLPLIFKAYAEDRVTCTMLREKLWDIATGKYRGFPDERGVWRKHDYNLDSVARRRAGIPLKKDGWRKRYGEFYEITDLRQWPARAAELAADARIHVAAGVKDKDLEAVATGDPIEVLTYPLEDARATLAVHLGQDETAASCDPNPFADQFRRARDSFWENLMSIWGLRTHALGIYFLKKQTREVIDRLTADLVAAGLVRSDGSRDTKAATARMLDVMGWRLTEDGHFEKTRTDARPLRKTKGGGVSLDRDACKESDDPILIDYGDRAQMKAVEDKDVPMLEAGTIYPVHSRIDLAASGRTTSSAPNIRNLRRLPGIREAFVPRDGYVFVQADYPGLELRTLAQTCFDLFGYSVLGDMLNRGEDPHLAFAAKTLGISYEEAKKNKKRKDVDDARQTGKVFNFGSPGGLGAEKLVLFARKTYGVTLTVEQAKAYKREWLATFPEMRDFFNYVGRLCDNPRGEATILQLRSNRIRGGCLYTAACNSFFQGLGADATQDAGFEISRGCYDVTAKSPLFGARVANYVYDEFILETREMGGFATPTQVAQELVRIMKDVANRWIPKVPFKDGEIEPLLMRVWSKEAETYKDANGNLVPWEPALAGVIGLGKAIASRVPSLQVAA